MENGRPCVSPLLPSTGRYTARGERTAMCLPVLTFHNKLHGSWRTDGHVTRLVENGRPCVSPLLASTGRYTARGERTAMCLPVVAFHGQIHGSWRTDGRCLPVVTFTGSYKARGERMAGVSPATFHGRPCYNLSRRAAPEFPPWPPGASR